MFIVLILPAYNWPPHLCDKIAKNRRCDIGLTFAHDININSNTKIVCVCSSDTGMSVHKECLEKAKDMSGILS